MMPGDHPQRAALNDEAHARPAEPLSGRLAIAYLAMFCDRAQAEESWHRVGALAAQYGAAAPVPGASHFHADFGAFRMRWERHTEFVRFTIVVPAGETAPFATSALAALPEGWMASLPGQVVTAIQAAMLPVVAGYETVEHLADLYFAGNVLIGSKVSDDAATVLTDLRIGEDGCIRMLVLDHGMAPAQAGRVVQRLLEIDTYRILAMMALPVAQELAPFLAACERELAGITAALVSATEEEEPKLLDRLTALSSDIARRQSANVGPVAPGESGMHFDNLYRFGAAAAYYELVQRRIGELREHRLASLQNFAQFTERRLAPAMNTCRGVAARQDSLLQRVARATQLLSTRVAITRERQNQLLLAQMNRRARLQLLLQETVETVSIAAVTYYAVGLVGYVTKALNFMNLRIEPELAMGASVPVVALLVWLGGRRIRRAVNSEAG